MSDNINLLVTYTIKGNKRQEFLAAVNQIDLVRKTRKETGNKEYRYLLPIDNYAQIVLIESWTDEECLNGHRETEHFKELVKIKEKYVINTSTENFKII